MWREWGPQASATRQHLNDVRYLPGAVVPLARLAVGEATPRVGWYVLDRSDGVQQLVDGEARMLLGYVYTRAGDLRRVEEGEAPKGKRLPLKLWAAFILSVIGQ